jgi:hypothetical protein
MTNTEQSREGFEKWCLNNGYDIARVYRLPEDYANCATATEWHLWNDAWQSRQPEIDALKAEIARLTEQNAQATAMCQSSFARDQERQLELAKVHADLEFLRATPTAPADMVEALREAVNGMGGSYAVWAPKAEAALSRYEAAQQEQRTTASANQS